MPAPATVDELLDLVQKSGVADEAKLKAYLARTADQGGLPREPSKVAGFLVRDGLLTYFQAEQLLQGKWKRFSIGKYKVLERLGAGGMGQVFLCEHKLMRRRVAVKVLPTAKAADEASLGRFYREARAVAAVDHPNIVRAYDIDQDDNLHFLVMEYVDGTNLQDLIKKNGPLDVLRACHYMYGSAVGLQHAHEIGLVHRDIKPGNILLDRSGVVKILDMGLARFFHDSEDNLTKQYDENILGTADYLSPEQAEDSHTVDIRTDIYSLGATFYYLLTGSQPFPEGTIPQKLIWHRSREPKAIQSIRPEVPDEVVAVVRKMMAKKPEDRYQTPAELMAAPAPWAATPIPPPPEKEMPQLSPAVMGGAGAGSGRSPAAVAAAAAAAQRSMAGIAPLPGVGGPGSGSGSGVRVTPTSDMRSMNAPAGPRTPSPATAAPPALPVPMPLPADAGDGVWGTLEQTPAATDEDTVRPGRTPEPKPRPAKTDPKAPGKRLPLVLAGVGGLVLVLALSAAGVYFAFFDKKKIDDTPIPQPGPKRLLVSKHNSGAESTFSSLPAAIKAASPGDTIAIADAELNEPPLKFNSRSIPRDVTIESGLPDGKPAVIAFAYTAVGPSTPPMLELSEVENLRFRNVVLDGKGIADYAVQVNRNAPGVTFDGVLVKNVKKAGFLFQNAAGQSGRPLTLSHVRVVFTAASPDPTVSGVKVEATGTYPTRWVSVRNSRIEGPCKAGVRFDGAVVDSEVTGNRFWGPDAAVVFGKPPDGQPVKVQVSQNTVLGARGGLAGVVFNGPAKFEVAVSRNYFANIGTIARVDGAPPAGVTGVTFTANGHDAASQPGPLAPAGTVTRVDNPKLVTPPKPDDDATFLRFPGEPPVVAGTPVGATPE